MKHLILIAFIFVISLTNTFARGIKLIAHESTPVSSLSPEQVRDIFFKKNKEWSDGTSVRFFDRNDSSSERNYFLKNIIRQSQREVETFWIGQKLYTGHSAPTQVTSDSMMVTLVSRFPGAIGYVSSEFQPKKNVKVIDLEEK